jgi:hypothetical protein
MSNLLIYRFILFNLSAWIAVGIVATKVDLVGMVLRDWTFICAMIVVLFLAGFIGVTKEVIVATKMRNGTICLPLTDREKDMEKVAWLDDVTEWLVRLGLIGTVVGFAIALTGVAENAIGSVEGTKVTIISLMAGMRIALNTTILGAIAALWHGVNARMLRTALISYWSDREKIASWR